MPVKYRKVNQGKRAQPSTISAPTGGLNGRDSFTDMDEKDAYLLDNWFPSSTSVDTRGGSLDFATGVGGAVESLEVYTGAAGSKMLAFGNGSIFDVSAGGAVGTALATGKASNKVKSCMFSNAGAQSLLIFSGADAPLRFDGTTLTALTITGMTGSQNTFFDAMAFKGRVYLAQAATLGFYYLAVGAIQGAASFFDLSQQSLKGGGLAGMCSFSQDSMGDGPSDYALFITTEGEYILYSGTDPSSADNWALVSRYYGPPPIGKRGWFKFRGEVYFITEEGILSFTQIRQMGEDDETDQYLSAKLGRNFTDAVAYQSVHGWSGMIYPHGSMLMVNVPMTGAENGPYCQFVMNTNTNAWARFVGWNGISWTLFNRRAYFGTNDGKVVLADEGFTDNGVQVQTSARQAWNDLDGDGSGVVGDSDKQFHFATFAIQADGIPSLACNLNVNFEDDLPANVLAAVPSTSGAAWDTAFWDTADWAGSAVTQSLTASIGKLGYIASVWLQASSPAARVRWFATRITFERTKGLVLS